MTPRHNTCPDPSVDVVAAAKSLAPLILDSRDEGEQIRRVPPRVGCDTKIASRSGRVRRAGTCGKRPEVAGGLTRSGFPDPVEDFPDERI